MKLFKQCKPFESTHIVIKDEVGSGTMFAKEVTKTTDMKKEEVIEILIELVDKLKTIKESPEAAEAIAETADILTIDQREREVKCPCEFFNEDAYWKSYIDQREGEDKHNERLMGIIADFCVKRDECEDEFDSSETVDDFIDQLQSYFYHTQPPPESEKGQVTEGEKHKTLQGFMSKLSDRGFTMPLDPEFNAIVQSYFWDLI